MSLQVPVHFVQSYSTNVQMLLQQKGGKLASAVTQGSYVGKAAKAVEQIGAVKPVKNLSRHADTPLISTPGDARWVFPNDYEWADLIDDQDKFAAAVTDKLATYALRRGMTFSDREELKRIAESSKADGYKLASLIESLVTSPLFLKR